MRSNILILGLHRVGYPPKNAKIRGLFTSPKLLAFQIKFLRMLGYRFMTLRDAMTTPVGRIAVLTFDDGYADNFTNALPILEKYNVPATLFVITNDIGKKSVIWAEAGEDLPADILTWEMAKELERRGWEIGSHAHEHIHFNLHDETKQADAVRTSIGEIEKNLGVVPISFAYPYGGYTAITKSILRQQGIRYAVTTNPIGWSEDAVSADLLELRRLMIGGRKFHHFVKAFCRTLRAASPFSFGLASRPSASLTSPVEKIN
jgi:peptidoglycan/xylan/chitin deacetylase (PgdA/CDA1 family)